MEDEWRERAKCRGDDLKDWMPDSLPTDPNVRRMMAQGKCSACPVWRECGLDALKNRDIDVIRAGVALEPIAGPKLFEQYNRIRVKLGIPLPNPEVYDDPKHISWPRECMDCGRTMRPRSELARQWPGTAKSFNRHRCDRCQDQRIREAPKHVGPVGLSTLLRNSRLDTRGEEEAGGKAEGAGDG